MIFLYPRFLVLLGCPLVRGSFAPPQPSCPGSWQLQAEGMIPRLSFCLVELCSGLWGLARDGPIAAPWRCMAVTAWELCLTYIAFAWFKSSKLVKLPLASENPIGLHNY